MCRQGRSADPPRTRGSTTTSSLIGSCARRRDRFLHSGTDAPDKIKSPRIEQFHPLIKQPDGTFKPDEHPQIRADHAEETGSRFPDPGYKITE